MLVQPDFGQLTFLIIVTIVFSPWTAGAAGILAFCLIVYMCIMIAVWRNNRYFLPTVCGFRFSRHRLHRNMD
jgi:cell division protein FtsW (lipid II flippase)